MALSKEKIKWITSLKLKKNRQTEQLFLAEGVKIAHEVLTAYPQMVHSGYATAEWLAHAAASLPTFPSLQSHFQLITADELAKISDLQTPHQVLLVLHLPPPPALPPLAPPRALSLALDRIQDPGNMGTIIRIADWFGIHSIFCSDGCADWHNTKVLQATMGSFLRVPIFSHTDLAALLRQAAASMPVYGAVLDGTDILRHPPTDKRGILVIGNESQGIAPDLLPLLTHRLTIPRIGNAESLNAGVATGILCSCLAVSAV